MDRLPPGTHDERILVIAPTAVDAAFCRTILAEAGFQCALCADMGELEAELRKGAGAVLLTDATLATNDPQSLAESMSRQPRWSDIPVLLLAGGGQGSPQAVGLMEALGNVTVLDRPVRVINLVSALRSAIKARRRQYELRDHIDTLRDTEATLRTSEQQFRQLVETSLEGIWQIDVEGRTTYVNRRLCQMLSTPATGIMGRWPQEFADPGDVEAVADSWTTPLGGDVHHGESRLRRADGSHLWVLSSSTPMYNAQGEVVGAFAMLTDITARRVAEDELRETSRRKDEFVATLAHELRNPLAPIRHSLDALRIGAERGAIDARLMPMMERQVLHMVRLIDELLDVSRVTRGTVELQREPVDFRAVLASALEASAPLLDANDHRVEVNVLADPVMLDADSVRLAQVFTNILNNAAKFTPAGGLITVTSRSTVGPVRGAELVVSIRDSGIGIRPEHLPRVFDMFSQAEPAVGGAAGGLGIGLALAKALIELHGGAIEARSQGADRGSEFLVRLPLAAAGDATGPVALMPSDASDLSGLRVLVIDDNTDAADSLVMLIGMAGAEARAAYHGEQGLRLAQSWHPDVAVLDIGMPGMDGFEVARRMKEHPRTQAIPLVALTGWGKPEDRRRSVDAGMQHHLVKPVDFDELSGLLRDLRGAPASDRLPHLAGN